MTPDRDSRGLEPEPSPGPAGSQVFLLRLWTVEEGGAPPVWHGKIQHVLSGEAARVTDLALLPGTLQVLLAACGAGGVARTGDPTP